MGFPTLSNSDIQSGIHYNGGNPYTRRENTNNVVHTNRSVRRSERSGVGRYYEILIRSLCAATSVTN